MQTIDAGVRQIALLADDSTDWGAQYGNDNTYVRVLKDLTDWIHELQQEKNDDGTAKYEGLKDTILYCPALYSYTGAGDAWYKDIPSNVQIVMTGGRTFGVASKDFADTFTKNTGRAPFMWINWPCSDMNRNTAYQYLVMGGQNNFLKPGATYGTYDASCSTRCSSPSRASRASSWPPTTAGTCGRAKRTDNSPGRTPSATSTTTRRSRPRAPVACVTSP